MRGGRVATREEGETTRYRKIFGWTRPERDDFVEVIETMLRDSTPFVLSSAIAAFQEVCPHRIDLLHRHYRKLARILVDIDEWGQMLTCELLLRYARTQFLPPDGFNRELNVGKDNENNEEMLDIAGFNELNGSGGGTSGYDRHDTGGTKGILARAANFLTTTTRKTPATTLRAVPIRTTRIPVTQEEEEELEGVEEKRTGKSRSGVFGRRPQVIVEVYATFASM